MSTTETIEVRGLGPIAPPINFTTSVPQSPGLAAFKRGVWFDQDTDAIVGTRTLDCSTAANPSDHSSTRDFPEFLPFEVYASEVGCTEDLIDNGQRRFAINRARVDAGSAWALAREVWTGATVSTNPSLQSAATLLTGGGSAVSAKRALAYLVANHHDAQRSGEVYIHMPETLASIMAQEGWIKQVGAYYTGPMGSRIVPGPGYPYGSGSNDSATAWGPVSGGVQLGQSATQVWMYSSGRIEWDLGEISQPLNGTQAQFPLRANGFWVIGSRPAIYRFDTTAVYAQLVSLPE